MDYALVLTHHSDYAGRLWGMTDNDYATLTMHDDGPKPTKKSLDDRWTQVQYERDRAAVEAARRARYQAETDGLFFAAQREGGDLSAWQAAVDAIKADLPYPEAPDALTE
jgi:hypothetical protein